MKSGAFRATTGNMGDTKSSNIQDSFQQIFDAIFEIECISVDYLLLLREEV